MNSKKALAALAAVLALIVGGAVLSSVLINAHVYAQTHRRREALQRQRFNETMEARYRNRAAGHRH